MSRAHTGSRLCLVLATAVLSSAGCTSFGRSGDAFSPMFPDNEKKPTRRVVQRLPEPHAPKAPDNALGKPVAVGTSRGTEERSITAFDLSEGTTLWSKPFDAMTRPEIRGDVVLSSTRKHVVAFDLRSGERLWREELDDLHYIGSARQGNALVYVTSIGASGGMDREGRVVAVDARSGSELWERETRGILARPAIQGGMVFVPWDRQNIAILDLRQGKELARLRTTDDVIDWAYSSPAGVFYGSQGIYRLTAGSYAGTKKKAVYRAPPVPEAPGDPLVHDNGFMPTPGTRSARGRIRIYFEPAPPSSEEEVAVLGDRFYFVYYRYVFAFDSEHNLQWVRNLEQDVLNAQPLADGLLTFGAKGQARVLDAKTGNDRWKTAVDRELASAGIEALGFEAGGEAGKPRDLRKSLNEIALDPDNRLVPARAFAIKKLAELEEPEITRDLLDLYAQRSMPGALKDAIGKALKNRDSGSKHLVEALDQHYDYLEGTRTPPLEIIVPALLQMEVERALPGLVSQLNHPATPTEVLPLVIRGIVKLGGDEAIEPLREFLVLYHADSSFEEQPKPLLAAARGLFERGGPKERELLKALMGEKPTRDKLAKHIGGMFEAEQRAAERRARAKAEAAARAAAEAAREQAEERPKKLDQSQINQSFAEHADALRECVMQQMSRQPQLARVRIAFIVENDGSAYNFRTVPSSSEFTSCLEPTLERIQFPKFKQRRQRATFTMQIGGQKRAKKKKDKDRPWWYRQRARAPEDARIAGRPWWQGMPRRAERASRNAQQRPAQRQPQHTATQASSSGGGKPWWTEAQAAGGKQNRTGSEGASQDGASSQHGAPQQSGGGPQQSSEDAQKPGDRKQRAEQGEPEQSEQGGDRAEQDKKPEGDPWWAGTQQ